jgi:hypothetical protein
MHDNPEPTVWVLTDGKAGDELQCLGVAERLGVTPEIRRVKPRSPWAWLMPRGPIDPREAPDRPDSPLHPPFPDRFGPARRRLSARSEAGLERRDLYGLPQGPAHRPRHSRSDLGLRP